MTVRLIWLPVANQENEQFVTMAIWLHVDNNP